MSRIEARLLKLEKLQPNENTRPLTLAEFRNLAWHEDSVIHDDELFPVGYIPTFTEFKAGLYRTIEREKMI